MVFPQDLQHCKSHDVVTSDVDCVYRLYFVILPRALTSTGYALLKEPICPAVIGWYLTAVIGAIRRNIPSAIGCRITLLVLSCVFIFADRRPSLPFDLVLST